ncbi:hypothetical protein B0A48_11933 [Cryoendolithus antarcticus]|uniref:3-hydroxyisobutyrate dehydrogenase n=1 Tax=Cryoendolithus antarcticus TaxID=1507870 RepID=A0A1V8STJ1_9PEZI|nr:hypothetical protein B0A48_11933 [Cryoendolithus antarcticus]
MAEEDFFSDGELDDIPDNTLLELEQHAISSTQRVQVARPPPPPLQRNQPSAASVQRSQRLAKNAPWRPPQPRARLQSHAEAHPASRPVDPSSSDYGFDEENVIDLDEPSMIIQPASGLQSRTNPRLPSRPLSAHERKAVLDAETAAAFAAADAELGVFSDHTWPRAGGHQEQAIAGAEATSLQARIAQLEAEQARLRRAEQDAREAAFAKQGEITIVRSNHDKATREYERRISVMQKLHADEAAKHKVELESTRKEREKMETDNRFLQHDLAQEAERTQRLNGHSRSKTAKNKVTPGKVRKHGLGDGFEDSEVRTASPSRTREKTKDGTPKGGLKRKRSAHDSPLPALSFDQPAPSVHESTVPSVTTTQLAIRSLQPSTERTSREFVQRMLNHKRNRDVERTVEVLTKYSLPTAQNRSLASIFLDALTSPPRSNDEHALVLQVSRALLKLWTDCLHEKYYIPLGLLLDLLKAALLFERAHVICMLIDDAVPLIMRSVEVIVTPSVQPSRYQTQSDSFDPKAHEELVNSLEVDDLMDFLLNISQCAALSEDSTTAFWTSMSFTITLLTLHKGRPISQLISALQVLATSVTQSSFGAICKDTTLQDQQERYTVDRLTLLLFDTPEAPKGEESYLVEEIAELRIEILSVLRQVCLTDHGGQLLAHHRNAIGRLVRFLDAQITRLYTTPPSLGMVRDDEHDDMPTAHDLIIRTVNMTVRLLHHLLRTFDSSIDLTQKLAATYGGYHKFLISLTRVAFSEQLVCEAGIEDEVIEAAHDILDNVLSPEEGEAIVKAVETPRGTHSVMGLPMARNLLQKLDSETQFYVFDVSADSMGQLVDEGANRVHACSSSKDVADKSDMILSMVPEGSHVRTVYLTESAGVLASDLGSKILIDCSTIDTGTSLDVRSATAAQHPKANFYDAPVSGGAIGASKATLTFMLGCSNTDPNLPHLTTLLSYMGSNIFPCGGPSLGLTAKLCNNYCSGLIAIAVSEAMNIGMASGMDPRVLANVFHTSTAQSAICDDWCPVPGICPEAPASKGYQGGFRVQLMKKDFGLAVDTAERVGVKLALGESGLGVYEGASADERCRDLDSRVVFRYLGGQEEWREKFPEEVELKRDETGALLKKARDASK